MARGGLAREDAHGSSDVSEETAKVNTQVDGARNRERVARLSSDRSVDERDAFWPRLS